MHRILAIVSMCHTQYGTYGDSLRHGSHNTGAGSFHEIRDLVGGMLQIGNRVEWSLSAFGRPWGK